jgi:hypothetical protein
MSLTQYTAILSELYAHIVMQRSYQEIASLVLRGTTYKFDVHRVLDDVRALALEMLKNEQHAETSKLFDKGLQVFQQTFAVSTSEFYKDLGFKAYFEKSPVVLPE